MDIHKGDMEVDIGQRIKVLRKSYSMSQAAFASLIGISQGTLSEIEKGKFRPSMETVVAISREFGVKTDWILRDGNSEGIFHEGLEEARQLITQSIFNLINDEANRISKENKVIISVGELTSLISDTWTSMFNASLTPEEKDVLTRYRSLMPKDKKEIRAIMELKLSAYDGPANT